MQATLARSLLVHPQTFIWVELAFINSLEFVEQVRAKIVKTLCTWCITGKRAGLALPEYRGSSAPA